MDELLISTIKITILTAIVCAGIGFLITLQWALGVLFGAIRHLYRRKKDSLDDRLVSVIDETVDFLRHVRGRIIDAIGGEVVVDKLGSGTYTGLKWFMWAVMFLSAAVCLGVTLGMLPGLLGK